MIFQLFYFAECIKHIIQIKYKLEETKLSLWIDKSNNFYVYPFLYRSSTEKKNDQSNLYINLCKVSNFTKQQLFNFLYLWDISGDTNISKIFWVLFHKLEKLLQLKIYNNILLTNINNCKRIISEITPQFKKPNNQYITMRSIELNGRNMLKLNIKFKLYIYNSVDNKGYTLDVWTTPKNKNEDIIGKKIISRDFAITFTPVLFKNSFKIIHFCLQPINDKILHNEYLYQNYAEPYQDIKCISSDQEYYYEKRYDYYLNIFKNQLIKESSDDYIIKIAKNKLRKKLRPFSTSYTESKKNPIQIIWINIKNHIKLIILSIVFICSLIIILIINKLLRTQLHNKYKNRDKSTIIITI